MVKLLNLYIVQKITEKLAFDNLYSPYNGSKREKEKKKTLTKS